MSRPSGFLRVLTLGGIGLFLAACGCEVDTEAEQFCDEVTGPQVAAEGPSHSVAVAPELAALLQASLRSTASG